MNLDTLGRWAEAFKKNIFTLYLASSDSGTPGVAKLIAILTVGYALSPIDLIPDFIPIVGYLDDLLLLPAGIWLAIRLIPVLVWEECIARTKSEAFILPQSLSASVVVVLIWSLLCLWLFSLIWQ